MSLAIRAQLRCGSASFVPFGNCAASAAPDRYRVPKWRCPGQADRAPVLPTCSSLEPSVHDAITSSGGYGRVTGSDGDVPALVGRLFAWRAALCPLR